MLKPGLERLGGLASEKHFVRHKNDTNYLSLHYVNVSNLITDKTLATANVNQY